MRPAEKTDAAFMASLEEAAMGPHAVALWGQMLPSPVSLFDVENTQIICEGSAPVGYLTVETNPDHLRLRRLYLVPSAQGRGIGAAVMADLRRRAQGANLPLRTTVLTPNRRALAFYQREGLTAMERTAERVYLGAPAQPPELRA